MLKESLMQEFSGDSIVNPMYLFKVGKREHLELLKDGIVHFTPLSYFRGDGTTFRGDLLEGTYVMDTSRGFFINGVDISKLGEGFKATMTHADSDDVLVFCASMLEQKNFEKHSSNSIGFEEDFFNEMRKFGQHAIILDHLQFIENIKAALCDVQCNSAWRRVVYCDKSDHIRMRECIKGLEDQHSDSIIYFIKDESYQLQNEWRFIIDYINPSSVLKKNKDGSLDLKIRPVPASNVFDLNTARKP